MYIEKGCSAEFICKKYISNSTHRTDEEGRKDGTLHVFVVVRVQFKKEPFGSLASVFVLVVT